LGGFSSGQDAGVKENRKKEEIVGYLVNLFVSRKKLLLARV
jgi:hypothetical protein